MTGTALRYPRPLRPGDTIGVTAPSSGVAENLRPRLDFCVDHLRRQGFEVTVGCCMGGDGITSAPAADRAAELTAMLTDPAVRAIVPPWGGELAVDLLPLLDFEELAAAEPTWFVGYSDTCTTMLPLTLRTGVATLHAPNLMDTPFHVPAPLHHWLEVARAGTGATISQGAATRFQKTWPDFARFPDVREMALSEPAAWKLLGDGGTGRDAAVSATGRLLGGCLEILAMLPGTPFGDVPGFVREHAPEGLLFYVEVAEANAPTAARMLHHLRLAGWLDAANAVLVGRPAGPSAEGFGQVDALRHALGDLGVPVVYDVDLGHVPPQLALVNGALATVELEGARGQLTQRLV